MAESFEFVMEVIFEFDTNKDKTKVSCGLAVSLLLLNIFMNTKSHRSNRSIRQLRLYGNPNLYYKSDIVVKFNPLPKTYPLF